ncbi:MAG: UDP-N-acetyl-D-glucosamine 2-epimerase, UDP-hydrolysing [Bdellovibrionales bacterium RIFOXYB1_FULL_37_110]|nr:MAG: UDP-N-acetyl-D-glucosamine 2-epimerase, UDP-hydrolysing [Bdellovibrionales bacterium RIFOXYC1_FULL_37_79]OFZ58826.1 MAG: UDP-N-acetyl-D-glucosamine 2-epimerase, UDP-hydrolysing [Bdellovibrionales bacterium RIFOXYB1_FULL_37_110]OFZ64825.1 MAG: UDP-N-acetyl-D-glucosamine 2-epimerase, UDP-hydrolysing [Bdellovibrionales bacterium RIFOXYD1_FULL_36_51]
MKKICVVTGSRADYGLLYWTMKEIQKHKKMQLQIVATGTHFSPEFGLTYKAILKDGFKIDEKFECVLSADTPSAITKSFAMASIGFSNAFEKLKPSAIMVLGDRYEALAAATSALIHRIPIIHLHGGEKTEGVIDEAIRHSITKMSHLHFVAADEYKKRVIQLGENPQNVFNVGALGVENIAKLPLLSKSDLQKKLNILKGNKNILITYHPDTLSLNTKQNFIKILKALPKVKNTHFIFTKANSDTDGRIINKLIDDFVGTHSTISTSFVSMGQLNYLSALKHVDLVLGNSSSGILEAPSLHTPTVNIGLRQSGRACDPSIIHCQYSEKEILKSISRALSPAFILKTNKTTSLYGSGNCSKKIVKIISTIELSKLLTKSFRDIKPKEKL